MQTKLIVASVAWCAVTTAIVPDLTGADAPTFEAHLGQAVSLRGRLAIGVQGPCLFGATPRDVVFYVIADVPKHGGYTEPAAWNRLNGHQVRVTGRLTFRAFPANHDASDKPHPASKEPSRPIFLSDPNTNSAKPALRPLPSPRPARCTRDLHQSFGGIDERRGPSGMECGSLLPLCKRGISAGSAISKRKRADKAGASSRTPKLCATRGLCRGGQRTFKGGAFLRMPPLP